MKQAGTHLKMCETMNDACRFRTVLRGMNEKSLVFAFSGHSGLNGPDGELRKLREASFKCSRSQWNQQ
jgi:hypothetical protein